MTMIIFNADIWFFFVVFIVISQYTNHILQPTVALWDDVPVVFVKG